MVNKSETWTLDQALDTARNIYLEWRQHQTIPTATMASPIWCLMPWTMPANDMPAHSPLFQHALLRGGAT
jgi:hypothetical protein